MNQVAVVELTDDEVRSIWAKSLTEYVDIAYANGVPQTMAAATWLAAVALIDRAEVRVRVSGCGRAVNVASVLQH